MKLFRKPCVNDAQVMDAMKNDRKLRLAKEAEILTETQYEYVRREHGYDFMPPSRYVPSQSLSEEEDESEDPRTHIEMPKSDLSDSFEEDKGGAYGTAYKPNKDPSWGVPQRGKHNVSTARISNQKARRRQEHERQVPMQQTRARNSPRLPPHQEETYPSEPRELPYRVERPSKSPHHRRSEEGRRAPQRQPSPYNETRPSRHSYPNDDYHRHAQSPTNGYHDPRGPGNYEEDYRRSTTPRGSGTPKSSGTPTGRPLQTAYSYASDSDEDTFDSRYEVGRTRQRQKPKQRELSGWGESEKSFNAYWRHKRSSPLDDFVTPAYRQRADSGASSNIPPRVIGESRYPEEMHRGPSPEARDPIVEERVRISEAAETRKRSSSRDFGMHQRRPSISKERYYEERRESNHQPQQAQYRKMSNRELNELKRQEVMKATKEKRRSRGILGRIRDSVRGGAHKGAKKKAMAAAPKHTPQTNNNPYLDDDDQTLNQELRRKGSLFEKSPLSERSDDNPHYQFDVPSARVPYPYDDVDQYQQSSRGRQNTPPAPEFEPPHQRTRRPTAYDRPPPAEEYWYDSHNEGVEMRRARSGAVPFESTRPPAPPLRRNPERPHRQIPLAASMSKHYRDTTMQKQVQEQLHQSNGIGKAQVTSIPHRGPQSPDLNFDSRRVKTMPKSKGFIGCY